MPPLLTVEHVKKSFGKITAVQDAHFQVARGSCFGLLGPNGAGKSTTIEMIQGLIKPDAGRILYKDRRRDRRFQEELGVQFQSTALPPKMKVWETLQTFRDLYRTARPLDELMSICQLHDFKNQWHEKISGGQRQRLLLAIALCHDPELILLDEPTTGLDPQARRHLWDLVNNIKAQGKTLILTTHYMDEAQQLCDEIAIMDHGRLIAQGPPHVLLSDQQQAVVVRFPGRAADESMSQIGQGFGQVFAPEQGLEIHTTRLDDLLQALLQAGHALTGMIVRSKNLEDLFLELTGKELRH
jgi:ABC-2 type transport system ATP-binding protein